MAASILRETQSALLSSLANTERAAESCSLPENLYLFNGSSPASKTSCFLNHSLNSSKISVRSNRKIVFQKPRNVIVANSPDTSIQTLDVPLESAMDVSYETLRDLLAAGEWEKADNETRRLICVLAGEEAVKRKWVYFTEVQYMPSTDLLTIDALWRKASGDRYGFSIQRRLWNSMGRRWKPFFLKIEWTYGENSTYKKFPLEFTWDISAPVGHLPLTNALRGTQLITNLLSHPAFSKFDAENTLPITEVKVPGLVNEKASSKNDETPSSQSDSSSVLGEIFKTSDYGF